MMDETTQDVVYQLNVEMYENTQDEWTYFEYTSTGFCEAIMFLGYPIWSSECDDRKWNEETDTPEDLHIYVKRESIKLIKKLQGGLKDE